MQKTIGVSAFVLLAWLAGPIGWASAQAPAPREPSVVAPEATPEPKAAKPARKAGPRKYKKRRAGRHWRAHLSGRRCFGHEWRAFPTNDPKGYFYAPAGGGIC
jgi:hypothetical protein